jgi:hypothetical protein
MPTSCNNSWARREFFRAIIREHNFSSSISQVVKTQAKIEAKPKLNKEHLRIKQKPLSVQKTRMT